jgi:shikimate dehydrogenase
LPRKLRISGTTRIAGVVGYPIAHTLSPVMQNAAFASARIDAVYLPFSIRPEALKAFLRTMADIGALGLNVTIPHKPQALEYMDEVSPEARRIGAVNTVVIRDGKLIGHNTDGYGFLVSIRRKLSPFGKKAVILGAGGAARAVAVALADAGAANLTLIAPIPAQRRELLAHLHALGYPQAAGMAFDAPKVREVIGAADLVVNTTPLGMQAKDPLPVPPDWLAEKACVVDLVYGRGRTRWLRAAAHRGRRVVPGWLMLLHQGAEAFRLWTGKRPPVEVMRRALRAAQWQEGMKETLTLGKK